MACEVLPQGRFSLTCELSHENKIASDQQNNIVVNTPTDNIILDCWIKTCDSWVAGVDFLCKTNDERAVSATTLPKRNINNLHIELGHPSKTITHATVKALSIQVTSTFQPCEDCTLAKAKQWAFSKAVPHSKNFRGKAFLWYKFPFYSNFWW